MKTTNDFKELYDRAKSAGLVHNQKQFAQFCNIAEATMSKIMNGVDKFLTDDLYKKAEYAIMKAGITIGGDLSGVQKNFEGSTDGVSSEDVRAIVDKLVNEMAEQRTQLMDEMAAQRRDFMELLKSK